MPLIRMPPWRVSWANRPVGGADKPTIYGTAFGSCRTNRAAGPRAGFPRNLKIHEGGNSLAFTQCPTHSDGRSPEPPSEGDVKFSNS